MTRLTHIRPELVRLMPKQLEDGILYVSQEYGTAAHKCACGCGSRIVTPLTDTFWNLTLRDGRATLYPSVGNWDYPCRSHYWIRDNRIEWAPKWTPEEIAEGRAADRKQKQEHYATHESWFTAFWKRVKAWIRID